MTKGRILQTGFTTQHVGRGTRFKYDPVAKLFADALRHYGYEVDHREVTPGEDLSGYDAIFSGLSPLNALSARYSYGGLHAWNEAERLDIPQIAYIDDWQTHLIQTAGRTLLKDPKRLVKPLMEKARTEYEWAKEHYEELVPAIDKIVNQTWPTTVMALYDGGDWAKFDSRMPERKRVVGVDPTPFYTPYDTVIPDDSERERSWVFGILSDQRKWLDKTQMDWPLAHRGGKASKAEDGGMPETELVQMYADSWGVLSCPYWHSGSGWFRIRHEHAMGTRSILYSENELSFISPVFDVKIAEVEAMSDAQLRELADAQNKAWYDHKPSKDEVATRIGEAFDAEILEHK